MILGCAAKFDDLPGFPEEHAPSLICPVEEAGAALAAPACLVAAQRLRLPLGLSEEFDELLELELLEEFEELLELELLEEFEELLELELLEELDELLELELLEEFEELLELELLDELLATLVYCSTASVISFGT